MYKMKDNEWAIICRGDEVKNIQEILMKCGGTGKLIMGNEEIDIIVISAESKIVRICIL